MWKMYSSPSGMVSEGEYNFSIASLVSIPHTLMPVSFLFPSTPDEIGGDLNIPASMQDCFLESGEQTPAEGSPGLAKGGEDIRYSSHRTILNRRDKNV